MEAYPIRATLVFALATTLTLLAAPVLARSESVWADDAGDETALLISADTSVRVLGVDVEECSAPAADIRVVGIQADEETLQLSLTLASLADLSFDCGPFGGFSAANARYSQSWHEVLADEDLTGFAYGITARAETTGFGLASCISIDYADQNGASGGCQGEVAIVGDTIVWTLPLRGSEEVDVSDDPSGILTHTETRAWDLSAFAGEVRGTSDLNLEGLLGTGVASFQDFATGGLFSP